MTEIPDYNGTLHDVGTETDDPLPYFDVEAPVDADTDMLNTDRVDNSDEWEDIPDTVDARLEAALDEIKSGPLPKAPYSLEQADQEQPFTHYTQPGNIFQILRYGIHSNNFKNRLDEARQQDGALDAVAPQISGSHFQKGASYQGKDSISLGEYDPRDVRTRELVFLVDPETPVFGLRPEERDASTGYGHGIVAPEIDGDFKIGNPTAYPTEVLAANIIPPSRIKGVSMHDKASIVRNLRDLTQNSAVQYSQPASPDREAAKENLMANTRLIASLTQNPETVARVDALADQIDTMSTSERIRALHSLQRSSLQEIVGQDVPLTESALRSAIERTFGVTIISNPRR